MLHVAGLATASGEAPDVVVNGCALGSLSMTSYGLGTDCDLLASEDTDVGTGPHDAPPDQANI